MVYKEIIFNINSGIATITLNRPEKLNAWTRIMAGEVRHAMYKAAEDGIVRVIVVTGAGRGFCAGADMSDLQDVSDELLSSLDKNETAEHRVSVLMGQKLEEELDPENKNKIRADFRKRYSYIQAIPKPVIAAVNGPAAGIGLILALHCDMRFASDKARFTTAFSKRGLIAEHGIAWILPRIAGFSNGLEMLFSSRTVEAQEAFRMGLVNRIFPADKFMEGVMSYAKELASSVSPRSTGIIKKQVYNAQFQSFAEASEYADEEIISSLQSGDFKEGVAHYIEKRPPAFTGK